MPRYFAHQPAYKFKRLNFEEMQSQTGTRTTTSSTLESVLRNTENTTLSKILDNTIEQTGRVQGGISSRISQFAEPTALDKILNNTIERNPLTSNETNWALRDLQQARSEATLQDYPRANSLNDVEGSIGVALVQDFPFGLMKGIRTSGIITEEEVDQYVNNSINAVMEEWDRSQILARLSDEAEYFPRPRAEFVSEVAGKALSNIGGALSVIAGIKQTEKVYKDWRDLPKDMRDVYAFKSGELPNSDNPMIQAAEKGRVRHMLREMAKGKSSVKLAIKPSELTKIQTQIMPKVQTQTKTLVKNAVKTKIETEEEEKPPRRRKKRKFRKPPFKYETIPMEAGTSTGGIARMLTGGYDFTLLNCTPTSSDLKAIDDFFTAYGYRVDKWEIPQIDFSKNIGNNECFYLKTGVESCCDCEVKEAEEQFDRMCNAGIRFWKTEIGVV